MGSFAAGEEAWVARLSSLRNVVRQELIARQLAEHVNPATRVLDIGCGQGTQAIRLAERGCTILGVDPSPALLACLEADARGARVEVETRLGSLEQLPALVGDLTFDLVCAHGLLIYLDDTEAALSAMAARVDSGGALSVTFRNGHALALRPGMRGQWQAAVDAMGASTYDNELGVAARAHTLDQVTDTLSRSGLAVETWYGVRLFTDPAPADQPPPPEPELQLLLKAEYEASRHDPYRHLGSQVHLIARRES